MRQEEWVKLELYRLQEAQKKLLLIRQYMEEVVSENCIAAVDADYIVHMLNEVELIVSFSYTYCNRIEMPLFKSIRSNRWR